MALFVDKSGNYAQVEQDLYTISAGDGGLGEADMQPDPTVIQITYDSPTLAIPGSVRLNDLINNLGCSIVITGLGATDLSPDGVTQMCQFVGGTSPLVGGIIHVFYDASNCNGEGYTAFDVAGNVIAAPSTIILFHELAHAYHECIGDEPATLPAIEFQAETDENALRAQFGQPLRDPNNHNGGGCSDCGAGGGGGGGGSCLIVTAAFDTPLSSQVNSLRRIRDLYLRQSQLGEEFFNQFCAEYYQFSPLVAAHMNYSQPLKALITKIAVEPLLSFLAFFNSYIHSGAPESGIGEDVKAIVTQFHTDLINNGLSANEIDLIYHQIVSMRTRLENPQFLQQRNQRPSIPVFGGEDFVFASLIDYLYQSISAVQSTEYIIWAILSPLTLFWQMVTQIHDFQTLNMEEFLVRQLDTWLASVPISPFFAKLSENDVREDLLELRRSIFTPLAVRQIIGKRLFESYGEIVIYDLESILKEAGYWSVSLDT